MARPAAPALERLGADAAADLEPLLAACFPGERLPAALLERVFFSDPDFEPDLALGIREASRLAAAALGVRRGGIPGRRPPLGGAGFVKALAVRPESRRRGLGGALLGEIERRLRARGARSVEYDGAAPFYLRPGLSSACAEGRAFLERRGYRFIEERISLSMGLEGADLSCPALEAAARARGIEFRRGECGEAESVGSWAGESFSPEWGWEVRQALAAPEAGLHLAIDARGGPVAFAAHGVSGPDVFGPMGTLEAWRGRGLGEVLLKRALAELRRQGVRRAIIGWMGPRGFYERLLPIDDVRRFWVLRKDLEREAR